MILKCSDGPRKHRSDPSLSTLQQPAPSTCFKTIPSLSASDYSIARCLKKCLGRLHVNDGVLLYRQRGTACPVFRGSLQCLRHNGRSKAPRRRHLALTSSLLVTRANSRYLVDVGRISKPGTSCKREEMTQIAYQGLPRAPKLCRSKVQDYFPGDLSTRTQRLRDREGKTINECSE